MDQLLTTKFYIPAIRPGLVLRTHLIEQLNQGLHGKLTLVTAPAGFGKTTLVSRWIAGCTQPVAWLSLDEGDNDPNRFLTYLISALNRVEGAGEMIGETSLGMLQSPQPPLTKTVLTSLINEITSIPERLILVLDDYHVIEASPVDNMLTFLLENLPPQLHLVIATREDPHLPLSRLRARGQLTELRAADLRFNSAEAAEFLNQMKGLNLSARDITALEARTEGWIAGLQLAAISMRGQTDVTGFIESFTGSHRLVLDYLVEEVLNQQDDHVGTFLIQTSILERLNGSLCDALTGYDNGQEILETLDRNNLFLIPLDNERRWYRFHHLFADVLQERLKVTLPVELAALHQKASEWYEGEDLWSDAIHHALVSEEYDRAARIAELTWEAMDNSFQSNTWLGWVRKIPDELIRDRPVLSTQYAWALWMAGELEASESRLQDAELWLDLSGKLPAIPGEPAQGMVVIEEEQFRTLPARIALARTYNAQAYGDLSRAVKFGELALKLSPQDAVLERTQATTSLGFIYWAEGDLEKALGALTNWQETMLEMGNVTFAIASTFALADILIAQGRLKDAERAYVQSLVLASEQDQAVEQVTPHLYLGLAMLYHEMGNEEGAALNLKKCRQIGEQSTLPDWPNRWYLAQAKLKESKGEFGNALNLLDEAQRVHVRVTVPETHPVEALKVNIYLKQGKLQEALAWIQDRGLSSDDQLSYLREYEHIILARVLLAEYEMRRRNKDLSQAIELLSRLLESADDSRRLGSVIVILLLQAKAFQAIGEMTASHLSLERSLTIALDQGYFRVFIDEGPPIADLLNSLVLTDEQMKAYVHKLLIAFEWEQELPQKTQPLIEPLSDRELEVLRLLETDLSGPEISRKLMIELSTFRSHTKNIFRKLEVNNRRAAVRKAKQLNLI